MLAASPRRPWNQFASSSELADALAVTVAARLRGAIDRRGKALIAVSGGTTPGLFFRTLSRQDLDWGKVTVTLADERFVPASSPRSNAALVAENLLQNGAAAANFAGLYRPAGTADQAAEQTDEAMKAFPWPLDVAVLGMGNDGHTASFFPDAEGLDELLDASSARTVLPVSAPSAGEPRLTLALPVLASAGLVVLHIEGNAKRGVLETALQPGSRLPVRAVFDHSRQPVEIFWAP
jgi:6-phosphogluconolactonase